MPVIIQVLLKPRLVAARFYFSTSHISPSQLSRIFVLAAVGQVPSEEGFESLAEKIQEIVQSDVQKDARMDATTDGT